MVLLCLKSNFSFEEIPLQGDAEVEVGADVHTSLWKDNVAVTMHL